MKSTMFTAAIISPYGVKSVLYCGTKSPLQEVLSQYVEKDFSCGAITKTTKKYSYNDEKEVFLIVL